jgi:hypothetical protein
LEEICRSLKFENKKKQTEKAQIKNLCKNNNNLIYININKELKNNKYYKEDMNHLKNIGYDKINEKIKLLI